jgi:hypothetical protein
MDIFDNFAQNMESFLSTKVQKISIKELWNQKPSVEATGVHLNNGCTKMYRSSISLFSLDGH